LRPPPTARAAADAELIQHSRVEPEQFAVIYDRHASAVHRYLARRAGTSIADDLTAETFLVAFRQRERYDIEQPDARPWLLGIATNLLRRQVRTEVRQYRAFARSGADPVRSRDEDEDDLLARVSAASVSRRLAGVLAELSERDRSVLLLIAWEQLTYEEVAQALGIPVGTVRSRLHNARKRVRAALADLDPFLSHEGESS
jgi:RNA polymerase sigma-70 factor (ECF subfamily)